MYTEFYGLKERPFALLPDPRFLYLSGSHREALAHLLYGIQSGEGFIEIVGQVGTGKTTLCRTLLGRIAGEAEIAYIFNPSSDATGLLTAIAREFGLDDSSRDRGDQIQVLNEFLLEQRSRDRHVLLVIDEAQNLAPDVLEQVRLLSNLETEREKLLQIVLIGQPELEDNLSRGDLRQLRQRITVRWNLRAFDRREVGEYVNHRLRVAGLARPDLFTPGALRVLYRASGGIPRMVNAICDRALLAGFSAGRRSVNARVLRNAARELPASQLGSARRAAVLRVGLVAAVLLCALGVGLVAPGWIPADSRGGAVLAPRVPRPRVPANLIAMSRVTPLPVEESVPEGALSGERVLRRSLVTRTPDATLAAALEALLAQWGYPSELAPEVSPADLSAAVRSAAPLRVFQTRVDLDRLAHLDLPAIVELSSGPSQLRYAALLGLEADGNARLALGARRFVISTQELSRLTTGKAFFVWSNFESVPVLDLGAAGTPVSWLQVRLAELGFLQAGRVTAIFDPQTAQAVRSFQRSYGLSVDGRVGPETLIALYQILAYEAPRLVQVGDVS